MYHDPINFSSPRYSCETQEWISIEFAFPDLLDNDE